MNLGRLARTVAFIPPKAMAWRVWARLKRRYYRLPIYGVKKALSAPLSLPMQGVGIELGFGDAARGQALAEGRWTLAGQELGLGVPPRSWAPPKLQALQLFEMHYHEWLADLRAANHPEVARTLVADWLLQFGHYNALAWHPYPTSLRVVAWLTHGGWVLAEADPDFKAAFMATLQTQVAYLRHNCEWDLGGNHLVKNLKALLMAALALQDKPLQEWAEARLVAALQHQILPDGAHDESTPHYHAQVLQDVLEVQAALRQAGEAGMGVWHDLAQHMGGVLAFYTYPDGQLGLWNDGVVGEAKRIRDLIAQSGFEGPLLTVLPNAGYARLEAGLWGGVLDAGKVGPDENPGHAHADTLALEFWVGAQRVVVNQGTLAYQHPLRHSLRATAAHSTLSLEGTDSAEVWAAHRVGRRPREVNLRETTPGRAVEAQHDGYRHLGLTHSRSLILLEGELRGIDTLQGLSLESFRGRRAWVRFHLHPSVQVRQTSEHEAELTLPNGPVLLFGCVGGRLMLQPSRYAPHWNQLTPTQQLAVRMQGPKVEWFFKAKKVFPT